MNDRVFELYERIWGMLEEGSEKKAFQLGFDLGISEGISRCTDKLKESK